MARANRSSGLNDGLPAHPVPAGIGHHDALTIDGLVGRPLVLKQADFDGLEHRAVAADFSCEEGWTVPELRWRGVSLATLAELVQPLAGAAWVRVCAGAYEVSLERALHPDALLCDELNSEPLPRDHGAPWRLLVPGNECFTSVKWVDHLEFTSQPGDPAGERIARARMRQL